MLYVAILHPKRAASSVMTVTLGSSLATNVAALVRMKKRLHKSIVSFLSSTKLMYVLNPSLPHNFATTDYRDSLWGGAASIVVDNSTTLKKKRNLVEEAVTDFQVYGIIAVNSNTAVVISYFEPHLRCGGHNDDGDEIQPRCGHFGNLFQYEGI